MNFIDDCISACKEVKELLHVNSHEELCEDVQKGYGGDISHKVDILAENIFIKHLQKYGQIFSEEVGVCGENSTCKIIIDPIDGSDNFISKVPYFGSSIAYEENGIVTKSFIVNYANDDVFFKNHGVLKFGKLSKDRFMSPKLNENSTLGLFERAYDSKFIINALKDLHVKFRSPGALALSLAYARNVDFVLYEGEAREFDIVAGIHMCEDLYVKKAKNFLFVSKNKQIFDRIVKILMKVG